MIKLRQSGGFKGLDAYLKRAKENSLPQKLEEYGQAGVAALAAATPSDSGLTASSWSYEITKTKNTITLSFCNSNIQNGVPIAVILQYGHATRNGGWVQGRDYINPSVQPVFDGILNNLRREVTDK